MKFNYFFCVCFLVLGFKLRESYLLGRLFTTSATPPAHVYNFYWAPLLLNQWSYPNKQENIYMRVKRFLFSLIAKTLRKVIGQELLKGFFLNWTETLKQISEVAVESLTVYFTILNLWEVSILLMASFLSIQFL
jgi:hypothetical protein